VQDCRILITRPEPKMTLAVERICDQRLECRCVTNAEISPIKDSKQRDAIRSKLFNYRHLTTFILLSKNAARLPGLVRRLAGQVYLVGIIGFGIGQGTTQALTG